MSKIIVLCFSLTLFIPWLSAAEPVRQTFPGDYMIATYFQDETAKIAKAWRGDQQTREQWNTHREVLRKQLLEMLGLDPLPEKTELHATVTGTVEQEEFKVEKLHFQSRPGLYVTANLYLPKKIEGQLPAILYVCGHGAVKKDGISYGNKVTYQHHGAWFARNGYACLIIDTLQMGEIEGIHHGTHRYNMWWWLNRGYTPAGVEAWNCVRALDYLQSRPEVDGNRLGVTGRSGGGAYSWWIAAIDDRIKCAVPVAGITDLQDHVVKGCVEGHCDCMYMLNTYRWDYAQVAALVAPRPLLISNTDSDNIFPLDGVVRVFEQARSIYTLCGARDKIALNITAGPHKDTQELQVHAFRWLNKHLKGDESLVEKTAVKFFEPEQLRVFTTLPDDQLNTAIQESFVSPSSLEELPIDKSNWQTRRDGWMEALRTKSFGAWPAVDESLHLAKAFESEHEGLVLSAYEFTSQGAVKLRLYLLHQAGLRMPELTVLNVLDETDWTEFLAAVSPGFASRFEGTKLPEPSADEFQSLQTMLTANKWAMAYVAPRGIGLTEWDPSDKKQTQIRRRFYLLGQTLDGMQVWDVRRAIQALRAIDAYANSPMWLQSHRIMAANALYASLFEPNIARLDLYDLPASHREGPIYLNVQRFLDMPETVAMAAERSRVVLYEQDKDRWQWSRNVANQLGWDAKQLQIRVVPEK
jgi:dienelactone hydrolase